jgi:hypothetical protein
VGDKPPQTKLGKEEKGMTLWGWRRGAALALLLSGILGCMVPSSPPVPPLTAAAIKHTLDTWNPTFCQVAKLYGIYQDGDNPAKRVAFVLIANPREKRQKPIVFVARFRLLTLPEGQSGWFLTSLVTHSSGLTRREGWDNLVIPVKSPPAAASP